MEAFSIHFEYLEPMMVAQACIVYLKQPKEREGRSERRGWFWGSYSLPSQSDRNSEVHRWATDVEGWGSPQAAALQTASLQLQLKEEEEKEKEKEKEEEMEEEEEEEE